MSAATGLARLPLPNNYFPWPALMRPRNRSHSLRRSVRRPSDVDVHRADLDRGCARAVHESCTLHTRQRPAGADSPPPGGGAEYRLGLAGDLSNLLILILRIPVGPQKHRPASHPIKICMAVAAAVAVAPDKLASLNSW